MKTTLFALACLLWGWLALGSFTAAQQQDIPAIQAPDTGPQTGLPLPRFVALKVKKGNMRAQPSTQHAILFTYLRAGLPMKVLRERGDWRLVEDHDGTQGWMKNTILTNDRTFRIMAPLANLYRRADLTSPVHAQLETGVIGDLHTCRADGWCRGSVGQVSGWIRANDIWGVLPDEVF